MRGHELVSLALCELVADDMLVAGKLVADDVVVIKTQCAALIAAKVDDGRAQAQTPAVRTRLRALDAKLMAHLDTIKARGATPKLWVQCLDMVEVGQRFLRAERLGDFELHCRSLREMLPHMGSCGRVHYVKAMHLHLDSIASADAGMFDVLKKFHAVRRSDRHWSCASDDHCIEIELMRSLKVAGGVFKTNAGLDTPAHVKTAMLNKAHMARLARECDVLVGCGRTRSDQHVSPGTTRASEVAAAQHLSGIKAFFSGDRDPFAAMPQNKVLRNLFTKVASPTTVGVHDAKALGEVTVARMTGKQVHGTNTKANPDAVFACAAKIDKSVNMSQKLAVKINGVEVAIDPNLLFSGSSSFLRQTTSTSGTCSTTSVPRSRRLALTIRATCASPTRPTLPTTSATRTAAAARRSIVSGAGIRQGRAPPPAAKSTTSSSTSARTSGGSAGKKKTAFKQIASNFVTAVEKRCGHVGAANVHLVADGHSTACTKSACQTHGRAQSACADQTVDDTNVLGTDRECSLATVRTNPRS